MFYEQISVIRELLKKVEKAIIYSPALLFWQLHAIAKSVVPNAHAYVSDIHFICLQLESVFPKGEKGLRKKSDVNGQFKMHFFSDLGHFLQYMYYHPAYEHGHATREKGAGGEQKSKNLLMRNFRIIL